MLIVLSLRKALVMSFETALYATSLMYIKLPYILFASVEYELHQGVSSNAELPILITLAAIESDVSELHP